MKLTKLGPDKWGHRQMAIGVVSLCGFCTWFAASSDLVGVEPLFLALLLGWFFYVAGAAAWSFGILHGRDMARDEARREAEDQAVAARARAAREVNAAERIAPAALESDDDDWA